MATLALVSALLVARPSRADVSEPGTRRVTYGFRVDNVKAFPDYVLLAFPWSLSNGVPSEEFTEVNDGATIEVGSRVSGTPEIYAVKRDDYAAWLATNPPKSARFESPELRQFFASGKAMKCTAKLNPVFSVAEHSDAENVVEVLRAEAIGPTGCALKATSPARDATTVRTPSPAPAGHGGCAGCAVIETPRQRAYLLVATAAALGAAALFRRQRRSRDENR